MTTKKLLLAGVLSFSILTLGGGRAYAAVTTNPLCKPDMNVFEKIGAAFKSLDIRKTVQNMITTAITDGLMNLIANRNPQQMAECSYCTVSGANATYLTAQSDAACSGEVIDTASCPGLCDDFTKTYDASSLDRQLGFKSHQTGGSLLGMANTLDGTVRTEPIPVNLAYYWNDQIKHTPFVSTALAADVNYGNAPAISTILVVWKTFRNIAFGLLSIIMLAIGVMIMSRKKLSPQLAVTVQYALPRVVLAVILIVFSYPIGAVLASGMRYFAVVGENLVCGITLPAPFGNPGVTCPAPIGLLLGAFFLGALIAAAATGGIALPILVVLSIIMLAAVVIKIAILIRAALLYMKLILSIVFSPIIFATGALPGNESTTQNQLKQWISYVAGYTAMFVYAAVVDIIVLILVTSPFSSFTPGTVTTAIFTVLFCPVIWLFGYIQALKIPGKVNNMIMGDPKKPGGKR